METQEITEAQLKSLLPPKVHSILPDEFTGILDKAITAGKLCVTYPHLNQNAVMISMVLRELIDKEFINFEINSILATLENIDVEESLKILQILVEAETDFASGEARIIRYFYH
ncbi:hypothetical protein [Desulforamulus reducens]|nr:hypothetical protein [Desulforamulus reducens]